MGNSGPVVSVICGNWWVLGAVVGSVESVVSGGSMGAVARGGCRGFARTGRGPCSLAVRGSIWPDSLLTLDANGPAFCPT